MRSGRNFCSFDSQYTPFKQKKPHSIISTRSWGLVYITFAHGRTDGRTDIFRKSFLFSCWSWIYIHVYTYLDYFLNFTPILTKVSIPFFLWKWVLKPGSLRPNVQLGNMIKKTILSYSSKIWDESDPALMCELSSS